MQLYIEVLFVRNNNKIDTVMESILGEKQVMYWFVNGNFFGNRVLSDWDSCWKLTRFHFLITGS